MLLLEHLSYLAHRGRVFRPLVGGTKGDDAREPQRESGLVADHAGGMPRAGRDLVGQNFDHQLGLQPDVRDEDRVDARGLLANLQPAQLLVEVAPALV